MAFLWLIPSGVATALAVWLFLALERQKAKLARERERALIEKMEAEKQIALMRQQLHAGEQRIKDWEAQRAESIQAAKAAVLEAGTQLSSKLLEDHKREAEAAKKESQAAVQKTSDALMEKFLDVSKSVHHLNERTRDTMERASVLWRALSSPSGAGNLAEIGLENALKSLGLQAGRDFVLQYAIAAGEERGALRPDAVVFLPQDMVMVIDCKASKFLLEIAREEEGGAAQQAALEKLKASMQQHLRDLTSKTYDAAVRSAYRAAGRPDKLGAVLNVMCVPSEAAIERIRQADPEFRERAQKAHIILVSPSGLEGLLGVANVHIGVARQSESQEEILRQTESLLDATLTALEYADGVGRGIKSAAEHFNKFARSVNARLLPKFKRLAEMGVKSPKHKTLPAGLTEYTIEKSGALLIEGEAETVEESGKIVDLSKAKG